MRIINCEQGTPEWFACRLGIPTASNFDKLLTPTGKASTQAMGYLDCLLDEMMAGDPEETEPTEWMLRGIELEAEARSYYEALNGVDVDQVGFVSAGGYGCSPDGLVGADGLLEIKCPKPSTHAGYLRENKAPIKYKPQIQGQLWVCERDWCDFMSYCPGRPPLIIRVERDEEYIDALSDRMVWFLDKLNKHRAEFLERGYILEQEQAA